MLWQTRSAGQGPPQFEFKQSLPYRCPGSPVGVPPMRGKTFPTLRRSGAGHQRPKSLGRRSMGWPCGVRWAAWCQARAQRASSSAWAAPRLTTKASNAASQWWWWWCSSGSAGSAGAAGSAAAADGLAAICAASAAAHCGQVNRPRWCSCTVIAKAWACQGWAKTGGLWLSGGVMVGPPACFPRRPPTPSSRAGPRRPTGRHR